MEILNTFLTMFPILQYNCINFLIKTLIQIRYSCLEGHIWSDYKTENFNLTWSEEASVLDAFWA